MYCKVTLGSNLMWLIWFRLVVGRLDDCSINWSWFLHNQLFQDAPSKPVLFIRFYKNYYHFRRKCLTFGHSLNIFHFFTLSAILSVHTKPQNRSGFLTAMWSLPDFYWREKNDHATMIGC